MGAYGGRQEIMEMVAPLGPMYQAGTLSGNPLAVTAGLTTLTELQKPGTYEKLEALGTRLADGITQAFGRAEVPATLNRVGSMMTGFMNPGPVDTLAQVEQSNTEALRAVLPRHAGKGRVPGSFPVRGRFRLPGPHRAGH